VTCQARMCVFVVPCAHVCVCAHHVCLWSRRVTCRARMCVFVPIMCVFVPIMCVFMVPQGDLPGAKAVLEAGKDQLEAMEDVEPSVSASVYYVASLLHKATGDSAEFYRSR